MRIRERSVSATLGVTKTIAESTTNKPRPREREHCGVSALRTAIERKYASLSEDSRAVLRRVAVFGGEFTLEAAIAVVVCEKVLKSQVPVSLVELQTGLLLECKREANSVRYRIPEMTRAHALKWLTASGEADLTARKHAEYFQHVFEDAEVQLDRQVATQWLADYGRYIDDVRAALDWSFSPAGDPFIGVGLTVAAMPLWVLSSRPDELCRRIELALESEAAATHSAREMQLRAAARLAGMPGVALKRLM
jgi:predicted ATPase